MSMSETQIRVRIPVKGRSEELINDCDGDWRRWTDDGLTVRRCGETAVTSSQLQTASETRETAGSRRVRLHSDRAFQLTRDALAGSIFFGAVNSRENQSGTYRASEAKQRSARARHTQHMPHLVATTPTSSAAVPATRPGGVAFPWRTWVSPSSGSSAAPRLNLRARAVRREDRGGVHTATGEEEQTQRTLYDLHGISSEGSAEEVRAAYRRMALRYHPDVAPPSAASSRCRRPTRRSPTRVAAPATTARSPAASAASPSPDPVSAAVPAPTTTRSRWVTGLLALACLLPFSGLHPMASRRICPGLLHYMLLLLRESLNRRDHFSFRFAGKDLDLV
jgi:hypothetical protein